MRILLADRDKGRGDGIAEFLSWEPDIELPEVVDSGEEAIILFDPDVFDILLLDPSIKRPNGFEVAEEISDKYGVGKIIFYSQHARKEDISKALEAGAAGFVEDYITNRNFTKRIQKVAQRSGVSGGQLTTQQPESPRIPDNGAEGGSAQASNPPRSYSVLIVDDTAETRNILENMLDLDPEFECIGAAGDGVEAIRQYEELEPDLVSMNLNMPRLDGNTASWIISAGNENAKILMLSMASQQRNQKEALRSGVSEFLAKPMTAHEYAYALKKVALLPGRLPISASVSIAFRLPAASIDEAAKLVADISFGEREIDREIQYQMDAIALAGGIGTWSYLEPEDAAGSKEETSRDWYRVATRFSVRAEDRDRAKSILSSNWGTMTLRGNAIIAFVGGKSEGGAIDSLEPSIATGY